MSHRVKILYRNHRGEVSERVISPLEIYLGATTQHPETQWLLNAWDAEPNDGRTFAMKDILAWGEQAVRHYLATQSLLDAAGRRMVQPATDQPAEEPELDRWHDDGGTAS